MKAYKVFRVMNSKLFSLFMRGKAGIQYASGQKSKGRVFDDLDGKKIRLPITAFRDLSHVREFVEREKVFFFEIWEVEGRLSKKYKDFHPGTLADLECFGKYIPRTSDSYLPLDTIFLDDCTPVKKIIGGKPGE